MAPSPAVLSPPPSLSRSVHLPALLACEALGAPIRRRVADGKPNVSFIEGNEPMDTQRALLRVVEAKG